MCYLFSLTFIHVVYLLLLAPTLKRFHHYNIHVENMSNKSHTIHLQASKSLKNRLTDYAEANEISESGAVRLILNQELPEVES